MNKHFLQTPEYDFLETHPRVKDNLFLLGFGGSHAYGTNVDTDIHTSDIDLRGIILPTKEDLLGFSIENYEQFTDDKTDTVLYTLSKMVKLLLECNPNTCEILGLKPEHYFYIHPLAQKLIDNADLFLSKRAFQSFAGYAYSQFNRLENAIARDSLTQQKKEEHILNSVKSCMCSLNDRYRSIPDKSMELYIDDSDKADMDTEIFVNINLEHYPLRDLNGIWNELVSIPRQYKKVNHRNKKKDDMHLDKHAMHLIRLYLMLFDIAEQGKIITYREKDRDFLLSIRNGYYRNDDGTYKKEFFDLVTEYQEKTEKLKLTSFLPDKPNYKKVSELVEEIQESWLLKLL